MTLERVTKNYYSIIQGYKGRDDYAEKMGGISLTSLNKNYKLLVEEIEEQINSEVVSEVFPIGTLNHEIAIQDFLLSLENEKHIKNTYKQKKLKVKKSGLNAKDTEILIACIRQGRSLLQAGQKAEMLAKPLIDFYAASAYAYAIIVLNSPLHKSIESLKRSHGHTYNHSTKTVDFGGDIPSGTFLDLLCALSVARVSQIENQPISFKYSSLKCMDFVQKNSIKLSLLPLLSMVPDLQTQFVRLNTGHTNVHKLSIDTGTVGMKSTYNFYIGDGKNKPDIDELKLCFNTDEINEDQGSYKISVEAKDVSSIRPMIYQDVYGKLWYISAPIKGLYLPELCLHFLIISALCNIMRYSPHEWSDILTNQISSQFSLIINQYIRVFERKFPLLVAQCLSNYNPIIRNT